MIVLGFDTATHATSVALAMPGAEPLERRDDPPAGAHPGHATRLLGMARALLAEARLTWSDVQRIAVGVGPGAFTGLRVGVATARGLAQSLGCEIAAVSSADALAHAGAAGAADAGFLAVIDARRGEAFVAAYRPAARAFADGTGAGAAVRLTEPLAAAPEAIRAELERARALAPELERFIAAGDGAVRYRAALEEIGAEVPDDASPLHRVSAAVVCALGAQAQAAALEAVLPDYRRRPDAELSLERRAPTGAQHG